MNRDREIAAAGLDHSEYTRIEEILGRAPNATELGMFGAMWSEHCSYKSSKRHLARFPVESPRVLQGPGENAGAVDVGGGLAAVFKVESHNHPTFIEPFQGAATGVGGILRDIFTMGARPVALMNSLRFGPLDSPANRNRFARAVAGIANYGNSMGIPTVGGETAFDECYALNPLVNAFALGVAPRDRIFLARAEESGSRVYCVGAKTGRDGIHGATMASATFDEAAEEKRPTVQVGDPFLEKTLMEACLELMRGDALAGVQDMGAAGLTCSSAETASRGGTGIELDLDLVPCRETGMSAYEIMLSESQERMLLVVRPGRESEVERVFARWDLDAAPVGAVTEDGILRVRRDGRIAASVPCRALTDEAPVLDRPAQAPRDWPPPEVRAGDLPEPLDWNETILDLVGSPGLASRRFVYEQYDHMVRSDTIARPGGDAGVVRIKGTPLALAMSLDGNGRHAAADPRRGGALAVAEACRNVAAVGALPIGATNCLNFGDPEKPEVMWQLSEAVSGMREALEALSIPITGGNVSLYNGTEGRSIFPTPVVGVVGVLEDASNLLRQHFRSEGDVVFVAGPRGAGRLGASEYLGARFGRTDGRPPAPDLAAEARLGEFLRAGAHRRLLASAKDVSDGGLAQALVESLFAPDGGAIGAGIHLEHGPAFRTGDRASDGTDGARLEPLLFAEDPARAVVSARPEDEDALCALAEEFGTPLQRLGVVSGDSLRIRVDGVDAVSIPVEALRDAFDHGLARAAAGDGPNRNRVSGA